MNFKSTSTVEESLITQAIDRDFLQYAKQYDIHDLARQVDSDAVNLIKEIKAILDNTSLDDSECLKILKQESGKEKKEKMRKFSKKIINEALDNLGLKVREAIREQTEEIESFFRNNIELQEKETVTAKYQYDEMLRESVLKEADIEKISIRSHIILKATELLEDML